MNRQPLTRRIGAKEPTDVGTHQLAQSVDAYLRDQGFEQVSALASVSQCWEAVVGPEVAAHVSPKAIRDGNLIVEIDHPTWATEVAFLSRQILDGLAERLGGPVADHLKVHVRA